MSLLEFVLWVALMVAVVYILYLWRRLRQAGLDMLTGLPRRGTVPPHRREKDLATYYFMIDVDGFKQINDTYGHEFGDLVLRAIGLRLRALKRKMDSLWRHGGEEFVLIANTNAPAILAERLRQAVEQLQLTAPTTNEQVRVTISIGFALSGDLADTQEVQERADKALYEAKKRGKNQFVDAAELEHH